MNNKGFTLIEVLVALMLMGIVVLMVSDDYDNSIRYWHSVVKLSDMRQYARYNMQAICEDVRYATDVEDLEDNDIIDLRMTPNTLGLELTFNDGTKKYYKILNDRELAVGDAITNLRSVGGPIAEVVIRRIRYYSSVGTLYEITLRTAYYHSVPSIELKQFVFAPNIR